MEKLYKLKDKLWAELDELAEKKDIDLDVVHMITDTIKNIDKICALEEGGYSEAGDWEGAYNRGSSYARRGKHYVRGHYSRNDARGAIMERAKELMGSATSEREREAVRRLISELERID